MVRDGDRWRPPSYNWIVGYALVFVYALDKVSTVNFSYTGSTGPLFWPSLFTSCAGDRQSPLSLTESQSDLIRFDTFLFINYDLTISNATIVNDGHSVKVTFDTANMPLVRGADLPGTYELLSYNFHWGSDSAQGAEHIVDGIQYPIELHLVHWNRAYITVEEALRRNDGIAILAVLFEAGSFDNPILEPIIEAAGSVQSADSTANFDPQFRPVDLLPLDRNSYFRYKGSLTTPECEEVVVWTIFTSTVPISERQLNVFRQLVDSSGNALVNNYRPVQLRNSRTIYWTGYLTFPDLCVIPYFCPFMVTLIKIFLISVRALIGVPIILG